MEQERWTDAEAVEKSAPKVVWDRAQSIIICVVILSSITTASQAKKPSICIKSSLSAIGSASIVPFNISSHSDDVCGEQRRDKQQRSTTANKNSPDRFSIHT